MLFKHISFIDYELFPRIFKLILALGQKVIWIFFYFSKILRFWWFFIVLFKYLLVILLMFRFFNVVLFFRFNNFVIELLLLFFIFLKICLFISLGNFIDPVFSFINSYDIFSCWVIYIELISCFCYRKILLVHCNKLLSLKVRNCLINFLILHFYYIAYLIF